jgi:hypothetical protein
VAVAEDVGTDCHVVAHYALGGIAAFVHRRRGVLDDDSFWGWRRRAGAAALGRGGLDLCAHARGSLVRIDGSVPVDAVLTTEKYPSSQWVNPFVRSPRDRASTV